MQLVKVGEPGILVDMNKIKQMKTPQDVDNEIDAVSIGNIEPVKRQNGQNVVSFDDYMDYLNGLKEKLSIMNSNNNNPNSNPDSNPDSNSDSNSDNNPDSNPDINPDSNPDNNPNNNPDNVNKDAEIAKRNDIITRLLKYAKSITLKSKDTANNKFKNVVYRKELPIQNTKKSIMMLSANFTAIHDLKLSNPIKLDAKVISNLGLDDFINESNEDKPNEDKSNEEKSNDEKSNDEKSNEDKSNEDKSDEDKSDEKILDSDVIFANAALARGLYGDKVAQSIIDKSYHRDGLYEEFLKQLGGE